MTAAEVNFAEYDATADWNYSKAAPKGELTEKDRLLVFTAINTYELMIGFALGLVANELSYAVIPFGKRDDLGTTVLLMIGTGVLIFNMLLYIRIFVELLPGVREYAGKEGFEHPPPVSLTFGFWITQNQLIARSKLIQKKVFELIKSPSVVSLVR